MTEPLTFADFLPDDRSPERKRCDELQGLIGEHMRASRSDDWPGWRRFLDAHRGETEVDRALFDLALRKELVASRDHAPIKPVLGRLFTEMDWWAPKGGYKKREDELRGMAKAFSIEHLRPETPDTTPNSATQLPSWMWIAIGIVFLILILS